MLSIVLAIKLAQFFSSRANILYYLCFPNKYLKNKLLPLNKPYYIDNRQIKNILQFFSQKLLSIVIQIRNKILKNNCQEES